MKRSNWLTILSLSVLFLLLPALCFAQSAINAYTAQFSWNAPTTGGAPDFYLMKCGTATGGPYSLATTRYDVPVTSGKVGDTVSNPGIYFCVVTASNVSGESLPSNEVSFALLAIPGPPTMLLIR